MNFDNFNLSAKELDEKKINHTKDNFFTNFINDLQKIISIFVNNSSKYISNTFLEGSIHVVRDINDNKISLVNSDNGQEVDIYIANSQDAINQLNKNGIFNNIYEMSDKDLYNLDLGSNVTFNVNKCVPYHGEDLYFCLEQEKNAIFSVSEISGDKIYLSNTEEGGYFSIPKANHQDFKVGDLVKNVNGKYVLI